MRNHIIVVTVLVAGAAIQLRAEETNCLSTTPADCQRSEIIGGDYTKRSFAGGNFQSATIRDASFANSELGVSVFDGATMDRVSFRDANLAGATFSGATLKDVDFSGANLRGARFDEAVVDLRELEEADTCMTTMPNETMNNEDCG